MFTKMLKNELEYIRKKNRYRKRFILPENVVNFSSNDYLGLKDNPETKEKLCKYIGNISLGSGASPLVSGYTDIQKELESLLASFKETENCIVVGSGYLANTGLIPALATEEDIIFSDELNHASIIDGIRLSKAKKIIYRHNDINDLEDKLKKYKPKRISFIITDGVFSMEGDIAPLEDIYFLAEKYSAVVIIDDAHGTGILGDGKGSLFHFNLKPQENIIQMGTLSKAVGSYGAFICGTKVLIEYLINKMRTGIFSTALSPVQQFISLENLRKLIKEDFRRKYVLNTSKALWDSLKRIGYKIDFHGTPILSLVLGSDEKALKFRDLLLKEGFFIQAIRPPTVPEGTARLRITISYNHKEEEIKNLIKTFDNLYREVSSHE